MSASSLQMNPGYSSVACLTLITLEWFQTVDVEARVIWKSRWGAVKTLFLLNRYLPFVFLPLIFMYTDGRHVSEKACEILHRIGGTGLAFGIGIAEVFLYIRLYALGPKTKGFVWFLIINGLSIPAAFSLYVVWMVQGDYMSFPGYSPRACIHINMDTLLVTICESFVMWSSVLTSALSIWFSLKHHWISRRSTVIQTMFRDGVIYFVTIAVVSVLNGAVIPYTKPDLLTYTAVIQTVLHPVLASRIILQLKNEARKNRHLRRAATSSAGSSIDVSRPIEFLHDDMTMDEAGAKIGEDVEMRSKSSPRVVEKEGTRTAHHSEV